MAYVIRQIDKGNKDFGKALFLFNVISVSETYNLVYKLELLTVCNWIGNRTQSDYQ